MTESLEALVRYFADAHPEEMARRLEGLDLRDAAKILETLSGIQGAEVLGRLNPAVGAQILARLKPETASRLLGRVPLRVATALLLPMDPEGRGSVLRSLPEGDARRLQEQLAYAPETAGSMMTPRVLSLSVDLTVQEAISTLRKAPQETIYYLYVTDRERKLVGVLSTRRLLFAGPREPIESILQRDLVTVPAHLDREEVTRIMDQKGFYALPVVDPAGRLLGVISHDKVLDAAREEAFEDMQKMSGAGGDERALSPVPLVVRKRLPWLTLNLGSAFLAAIVVGFFQGVIREVTALAVLMPVVSAVSGNAGIQALSVVMRGLALREIAPGNRLRVVLKEALAGLSSALGIGLLAGAVAWGWMGNPGLGLVMAAATVVNVVAATVLGASIPLLLRTLGRDPAQSSSIFLTTLTDIIGFGSFLGLAALLLSFLK